MGRFEERLRRLEERMAKLDVPSLDEVGAACGRVTERARARFRGEPDVPYEDRREGDRDTIERWAKAPRARTWSSRHRGQRRSSAE
jgi:hypothetical protein